MDIIWEPIFTIASYDISFMDLIDLTLVGYLLFRLYRLAKGTSSINIFFGLIAYLLLDKIKVKIKVKMQNQKLFAKNF